MSRRDGREQPIGGLGRRTFAPALLLVALSMMIAACFSAATKPFQAVGTEMAEVATHASVSATPQIEGAPPNTTLMPVSTAVAAANAITDSVSITVSDGGSLAGPGDELSDLLVLTTTRPVTSMSILTTTAILTATEPLTVVETLTDTTLIDHDATLTISQTVSATVANDAWILVPTPTPAPIGELVPASTPDGIPRSAQVPILMYHYVSVPPADADIYRLDLSVTPELFGGHLDRMLAEGYTTITLYDFLRHLTLGEPLPEKPVVLTFDDGYRDNYENALPALAERGMTAAFFVVTDFVDEERPEYLTWDMLREMYAAGLSIESHGRNHVSLRNKDVDYLVWQALGSYEAIEREIGQRPRFVSYPAGEYDQATMDLFKSANYWAGFTTIQGATHDTDNLFELHRVRVRGTTTPDELIRLLELDW